MEKDKKLERWSEYISELFDDDRNEDLTLQDIPEGPEIMREEVENTIKNMKTGKATGPDMISTEMMQALEDLFSLYSEMIMRQIEEIEGLKIGGHNINNIRYADDTVLTADSEEKLQEVLNKVVEESENKGLELNSKKTESMIITRKTSIPKCEIKIKENTIKQANSFKYLGTQITSDVRNHQEIKSRIAQAKASFQQMKSIMTNIKMSIVVRKRILEAFIEPVLLYGCEAWTINERMKRSLETTEMWFLRRMMRIPWTAKETNEEILTEVQTTRQLMTKIRKRQAKFVGHVIRRNQLEHLVTTGKFDGKRGRGRPREKMLDSLADWMNIGKPSEMIREMRSLNSTKQSKKRRRTFELEEPTLSAANTPTSDPVVEKRKTRSGSRTNTPIENGPGAKRHRRNTYDKSENATEAASPETAQMIASIDASQDSAERKANLLSAIDKKIQGKVVTASPQRSSSQPSQIPRFMAYLASMKKETQQQKPVTPGNKDWTKIHKKEFSTFDSIDVYLEKKQQRKDLLRGSGKRLNSAVSKTGNIIVSTDGPSATPRLSQWEM
ncbi:hypothetical protein RRG08_059702 [Elysia crispata]|uniref:Reverse transcriptase domain-containing protein n=1 Tax=Elysia crispata TaxID=231223 RepID=A0AAE1CKX8_9GAST|nr:hypothetical protein RRG08_059702 [Elysia crispata]